MALDQRRIGGREVERTLYAKGAGVALLVSVVSVLVLHLGPTIIAGGSRASGTSDVDRIASFYSHSAMLPFWWQGGISMIGILAFAVLFRRYLRTFPLSVMTSVLVDVAVMATVAVVPLYALGAGLQAAMVQLVAAGEAGRGGLLAVFASWDWVYNSVAYFFEAAYMAAWAIAAWRVDALPRWVVIVGGITAVGHLFNSQILLSRLPDELTLIPTVLFIAWFVGAGVFLVRGGRAGIETGHSGGMAESH